MVQVECRCSLFDQGSTSVGAVTRDNQGEIVLSAYKGFQAKYDVVHAEALAIIFGLSLAIDGGFEKLKIRV